MGTRRSQGVSYVGAPDEQPFFQVEQVGSGAALSLLHRVPGTSRLSCERLERAWLWRVLLLRPQASMLPGHCVYRACR